jgi:hypothetical protein
VVDETLARPSETPPRPDIAVTCERQVDDQGVAVWWVRAEAHGVGYNQREHETELPSLMNWLDRTVTFLMGRVAADQREEQTPT